MNVLSSFAFVAAARPADVNVRAEAVVAMHRKRPDASTAAIADAFPRPEDGWSFSKDAGNADPAPSRLDADMLARLDRGGLEPANFSSCRRKLEPGRHGPGPPLWPGRGGVLAG